MSEILNNKEERIQNPTGVEDIFNTIDSIFKSDTSESLLGDKKQDISLENGSDILKISHYNPSLNELIHAGPDWEHVIYSLNCNNDKFYDIISVGKPVKGDEIPQELKIYFCDSHEKNAIVADKVVGPLMRATNMINLSGAYNDNKNKIRHNEALNRLNLKEEATDVQVDDLIKTLEKFSAEK